MRACMKGVLGGVEWRGLARSLRRAVGDAGTRGWVEGASIYRGRDGES